MYYQGVKYNIPVALWLPERYPLQAPLAYVVRARGTWCRLGSAPSCGVQACRA